MDQKDNLGEITILLQQWGKGDHEAFNQLFPKIYSHLRRLASGYMKRESHEMTIQATALVNEVYLQMEGKTIQFENSDHFIRVAARMMRRLLTSYARSRKAEKRGRNLIETLDNLDQEPFNKAPDIDDLLVVEDALVHLEKRFPRQARIVELRVFMGFQNDEIAHLLEISITTVKREWVEAKRRLYVTLCANPGS